MADRDEITALGRLLGGVAREHHEATGGAGDRWAEWYASRLHGELGEYLDFEPTVAQITEWLRLADERYRDENPDTRWPFFYAELILESHTPEG